MQFKTSHGDGKAQGSLCPARQRVGELSNRNLTRGKKRKRLDNLATELHFISRRAKVFQQQSCGPCNPTINDAVAGLLVEGDVFLETVRQRDVANVLERLWESGIVGELSAWRNKNTLGANGNQVCV